LAYIGADDRVIHSEMALKEAGGRNTNRIPLYQDSIHWWTTVNTEVNPRAPFNVENVLASSRRALFNGVC
jgi:hypothetical protein